MDQINLERLGIPTVTISTSEFINLAKSTAKAEATPDLCFVVVPHPVGGIPLTKVSQMADNASAEILKALTEWQPSAWSASQKPVRPAERIQLTGTVEDVNRLFFEKGWSLGLPIIPPTIERVERLLERTSRKRDEVLGAVPPLMADLTVELVAVHAAMAGCKPEYMPVLIAALEALLAPEAGWRAGLTSTATLQSVVIVNGPIVDEIGIACGQGAAGKGYHPNGAIGYAINLVAYAVGGSRPPFHDKSTLGSPSDWVCWVFAENESGLPPGWKPLHVERGFHESDNVVTAMVSYPPVANMDQWNTTPEGHVRFWSYAISPLNGVGGPCGPQTMEQNPIVALSPEHAQLVASAGWSKDDLRESLWQQVRVPLSAWPSGRPGMVKVIEHFGPVTPDTMIPITIKPDLFLIVVTGGAGKQSHYFPPFPGSFPVSRLIKK